MHSTNGHQHCPSCKRPLLEVEADRYRCEEHGVWAPYGPRLLVLAPDPEQMRLPRMLLPWETKSA